MRKACWTNTKKNSCKYKLNNHSVFQSCFMIKHMEKTVLRNMWKVYHVIIIWLLWNRRTQIEKELYKCGLRDEIGSTTWNYIQVENLLNVNQVVNVVHYKSTLNRNLRIHTSEKPFKCESRIARVHRNPTSADVWERILVKKSLRS